MRSATNDPERNISYCGRLLIALRFLHIHFILCVARYATTRHINEIIRYSLHMITINFMKTQQITSPQTLSVILYPLSLNKLFAVSSAEIISALKPRRACIIPLQDRRHFGWLYIYYVRIIWYFAWFV